MLEHLAIFLQPYTGLIGIVATIVTVVSFFSGSVICKDIHRNKSTVGVSATPFIGGLVVGILMLMYGFVLNDLASIVTNVTAIVLNVLYTIVFFLYSEDTFNDIFKPLSYGIALVAVVVGYVNWEDEALLQYRYGMIITIFLLLLIGSPIFDLKNIIVQKDASSIPYPIVLMGTLVSFLWFLYGIVLLNNFIIIQNVIALALNVFQLLLCFIYPKDKEQRRRNSKNRVHCN